ncbi:phage tail length tape measure family protein [Mameliella alba]|nr:phage tail length tape measure family protein [Mameliella alba]
MERFENGMANAIIGALRAVLGMDSTAFNDGIGHAQKRAAAFRKSMEKTGRQLSRVGGQMSAALSAPLIGLAYKSVEAQKAQERAVASVTQALNSMGDGAGYTLQQLEAMASKLQEKSLYGDEEILSKVTANLLTFGNISGDVFARAQQAALDMSARLGTDLQSSAVMLGKALNDPVKGLTALTRVGVSFTEQQKEQIKAMAEAGRVAEAQALILAELEKQYSGQAEALARTDSGRVTQALNAIGDATEKIGAVILPILADIADHVKKWAEAFQNLSPETQRFIVIAGGLAAALGPVVATLGLMVTALAPMAGLILAVVSPLGLLILAAAAAGVALWKNWDKLSEEFPALTGAVEDALSGVVVILRQIATVANEVALTVGESLRHMAVLIEAVLQGDTLTALESGKGMFTAWGRAILASLDLVTVGGVSKVSALAKSMVAVLKAQLERPWGDIWGAAVDRVRQFGRDLLAALAQLLADVVAAALNIGREIVNGIKAGIAEKWQELKEYVGSIGTGIADTFRQKLGIKSPSRVFRGFGRNIGEGLIQGIKGQQSAIRSAMGEMQKSLSMDKLKSDTMGAKSALTKLGTTAAQTFQKIGSLIGEGIRGAKTFKEVLGGVLKTLAQVLIKQGQTALVNAFGGSGSIAGALVGGLMSGLTGFANGGSFDVGGVGGIDSQVVAFRASPNETVHITKPGQGLGGGGAGVVQINIRTEEGTIAEIARNEAGAVVRSGMAEYDRALPDRMARIQSDPRVRR